MHSISIRPHLRDITAEFLGIINIRFLFAALKTSAHHLQTRTRVIGLAAAAAAAHSQTAGKWHEFDFRNY
jgi:hypothetical protein